MRIDPTKGTAFEDNPLLFPDSLTGNYQESNLIWDGRQKRIALKAGPQRKCRLSNNC